MINHLLWVNVVVVALDTTILVLEYRGHYNIQTAYKGMAYSAKLKLEFSILNDLVNFARPGQVLTLQPRAISS